MLTVQPANDQQLLDIDIALVIANPGVHKYPFVLINFVEFNLLLDCNLFLYIVLLVLEGLQLIVVWLMNFQICT